MTRPKLLDLFCCAGGSAVGYHRAGFDVVGVDNRPQPRYPFEFHQADAIELLEDLLDGWPSGEIPGHLDEFDAIHASPPCQAYTVSRTRAKTRKEHPDLVGPVRKLLRATGRPYVIENVPGAPLRNPMVLCGSTFGLGVTCADGVRRALRRHRLFETSWWSMSPPCSCDSKEKIGVYGNGGGWVDRSDPDRAGYKGNKAESATAMGIDWMAVRELSQAIPPAFTQYIGEQMLAHLKLAS